MNCAVIAEGIWRIIFFFVAEKRAASATSYIDIFIFSRHIAIVKW